MKSGGRFKVEFSFDPATGDLCTNLQYVDADGTVLWETGSICIPVWPFLCPLVDKYGRQGKGKGKQPDQEEHEGDQEESDECPAPVPQPPRPPQPRPPHEPAKPSQQARK